MHMLPSNGMNTQQCNTIQRQKVSIKHVQHIQVDGECSDWFEVRAALLPQTCSDSRWLDNATYTREIPSQC